MFQTKIDFPFYKQYDAMDCGPACIKMIAEHYGVSLSFKGIKDHCYLTKRGVSMLGMIAACDKIGMEAMAVKVAWIDLKNRVELPCIAHWNNNHFVVVHKISHNRVHVADPKFGNVVYNQKDFEEGWLNKQTKEGALLMVEPRKDFYHNSLSEDKSADINFLKSYFKPYKKLFYQLLLGMLVGSLIQVSFPFLTQSLVDYGIKYKNLNFVYIILIAQLVFFLSAASVGMIRNWILLHITSRLSIKMVSDFLSKLLTLPIAYFQTKQTGDLMQRIRDHDRIEEFLSSNSLIVVFGTINMIVFGIVLAYFNLEIFIVFFLGTVVFFLWSLYFMKERAYLDLLEFQQNSKNQSSLIQLLGSITEIKLNGSEQRRKNEWKGIQYKLHTVYMKGLVLYHKQRQGGLIINQLKNILILFLAARLVIDGSITLGTMLAIQYIVGQLNSPIMSLVNFFIVYQEAMISIKRLVEIHNNPSDNYSSTVKKLTIPINDNISINKLSFRYGPPGTKQVLDNINVVIPSGKVTAIVGPSGSGKTTLLRLLLKFYPYTDGSIDIGGTSLEDYNTEQWRSHCGVVMQNGFIFNDTLERNITESDSKQSLDKLRLNQAIDIANLRELVGNLPNGIETVLGSEGSLLSGGERQRVLIARAVYKNPSVLFFDEATSSLDASNEKEIMSELAKFFKERTVIVIAHRLSTVRNADQIIVLNNSKIIETGDHDELLKLKGKYFELVKNQL